MFSGINMPKKVKLHRRKKKNIKNSVHDASTQKASGPRENITSLLPFVLFFSPAIQSSLFPETPHKEFLLETVIFSQHNDAISLSKYQNQCPSYCPASVLPKKGFSVDSIN